MGRVIGVNGIRTDGSTNTDRMLNELKKVGFQVEDINFPQVSIFKVPFLRSKAVMDKDAGKIFGCYNPGDHIIAHSYGCLLTYRAMLMGAHFGKVFWFAPAIDKDIVIPEGACERLYIIHNPNDKALFVAKLLFWHDFGEMGRVGYQGPNDERVENIMDTSKPTLFNHSYYFLDEYLKHWAQMVVYYLDLD